MKICQRCLKSYDSLHTKELCLKCYGKKRHKDQYTPHPRKLSSGCVSCGKPRDMVEMITKDLCKPCYNKEYKLKNKDKIRSQEKKWRQRNRKKLNEQRRTDRTNHPEKYRDQMEKWLSVPENREKNKQRKHDHYIQNKEKIAIYNKTRRNTAEHREKERVRCINKYRNDLFYNLYVKMSRHIKYALGKKKNGKQWTTIVGYNAKDLQEHILSLFVDGMTYEKLLSGEIHIDHKIPHAAFKYKNEDDEAFYLCWSLNNLRPIWANENYSKNDKLPNGFLARNLIYKIKNKDDYIRVLNGGFPLADLTNYNCEI